MSRRALLWTALAASVALNLFLGGLWAGGRLSDRGPPPRFDRGPPALAGLPPESREAIRNALRRSRPDRQAVGEARRAAARALAADPFDRAAAEAALRAARERQAAARARTDAALLDVAERLDPEQRSALARVVARGSPDGRRHGGPGR